MKPPLDKPPFTAEQLSAYRERFTLLASQCYWGALEGLVREMRKRAETPPEVLTVDTPMASALDDVRLVNTLEEQGIFTAGQLQAALYEGELGIKYIGRARPSPPSATDAKSAALGRRPAVPSAKPLRTLCEVAELVGLSPQSVSVYELRALAKLRLAIAADPELRDYVEDHFGWSPEHTQRVFEEANISLLSNS